MYVSGHCWEYPRSKSLQAFSIHDGHQIWKKDTAGASSVGNNIIYVQSIVNYFENPLYGYNAKTGELLFTTHFGYGSSQYLSPTIFDDHVYANGGQVDRSAINSFDASTGHENWNATVAIENIDDSMTAVNNKNVIVYANGKLFVLDRFTGKEKASIIGPPIPWSLHSAHVGLAPVLLNDNEVLVIHSGYLSSFNIINENMTWSLGPGYTGQPVFDGNLIYAAQYDGLVALDPSGKIHWKWFADNERVLDQMLTTQDLVFVSTDKKIYAISKETHEAVWSYEASGVMSMGMGHLYILDTKGNLTSIKVSASKS